MTSRSLGDDVPLDVCLQQARACGYAGVELGRKFPREIKPLREVLAAHDLRLVSGWASGALLQLEPAAQHKALLPHIELLCALGCTVLIFAETTGAIHGEPTRPLSARPRLMADCTDRLDRDAPRSTSRGHRG